LHRLGTEAAGITNPVLASVVARDKTFEYKRVILAAHSLGAVICRWALLFAHNKKKAGAADHGWVDRTAMVLFAPAHMGAVVSDLVRELGIGSGAFSNILRVLGLGVKYASSRNRRRRRVMVAIR
jgi:hypothetical protein